MSFPIDLLSSHSLSVLLVVATVISACWLILCSNRLHLRPWQALLLAVAHTALGVLAVKLFAIIEGFGDLSAVGNMSLFGGMAFLPIFYLAVSRWGRWDVRDTFDVFTVALVGTLFFARINCIISGCCQGAFIPGTSIRLPTREMELVYDIAFLVIAMPRVVRGEARGQIFPLYMVSYGAFRFLTEFLRASSSALGPFHIAHLWAFVAFMLGASVLVEIRQQGDGKGRKVRE